MRDGVRSAKFLDTLIEPARTRRIVRTLAGLVLFAACASAGAASLSGTYEGAGRDCRGLLQVQADFIAWHTAFANCAKSRYRVLDQSSIQNATRRVFQLKASTACSFAVITLEHDAAHPDYWNATGYRSQKDYRRGSDDAWLCNLTKRRQ